MKKTKVFLLIGLWLLPVAGVFYSCRHKPAEVVLCGTVHGFHRNNPNYSYSDLFNLIEVTNPDIIGVEIRPEDLEGSDSVLNSFYPYEMTEVTRRFSDVKVVGIDWWSESTVGKTASNELIENLHQRKLEKHLESDSVIMEGMPAILDSLNRVKMQIAADSSLSSIMHGCYDSLNQRYYKELGLFLNETPYSGLHDDYMMRHHKIGDNMVNIVNRHPGKRIVFLTGADHQVFAKKRLLEKCGDRIILNPTVRESP